MAFLYTSEIAGRLKDAVITNSEDELVQAALNDQLPDKELWSSVAMLKASDQVLTDLVTSAQSEINSLSSLAALNSYGSYTSVADLGWDNIFNVKLGDSWNAEIASSAVTTSLNRPNDSVFGNYLTGVYNANQTPVINNSNNFEVSFEIRTTHKKLMSFIILGTDTYGGGNIPLCLFPDIDVLGEKTIPFTYNGMKRDSVTRGEAYRIRSDYDSSFSSADNPITIAISFTGSVPYTWWSRLLTERPKTVTFTATFSDYDPLGSVIQSIPSQNYVPVDAFNSSQLDIALSNGIQSLLKDGGVNVDSVFSIQDMLLRIAQFMTGKFGRDLIPANAIKGPQIASNKSISYLYSIFETYLGSLISSGAKGVLTSIVDLIPDLALLL